MQGQEFQIKIEKLADEIDGCSCAFFSGYDGIIIFKDQKQPCSIDPDFAAANFVSVIKNLTSKENELSEIMVSFSKSIVAIHVMEDGFIGLILSQDANVGRAKLELRKFGRRFM